MTNTTKTKDELLKEVAQLRQRVATLETQEQKRAQTEHALKASETMYRTLAEAAHDIIFVVNQEERFEYINNFGAAIFGLHPRELINGKSAAPFPDLLTKHRKKLQEIFANGLPQFAETRISSPKGELWLSTLLVPLKDEAGKIVSVMGIARDSTNHKQIQEALRESEEKYRLLFYHSPIGILYYDTDLHITDCNDTFVESLQSRLEQLASLDISCIKDQRVLPAFRAALDGQEGFYEGLYQATTSPAEFFVSIRTAPLFGPDGKVKGGIAIAEDIGDRKRAEQTIQQQLVFLQTVIDTIPSAIFYKDVTGVYRGCNSAYEAFVGLPKTEIIGKTAYDIFPKDLAALYQNADTSLFLKPGMRQEESAILHADGTRHEVLFSRATFSDLSGKPTGLVGVMIDITERKRTEASLLESEQTLRAITDTATDAIILIDDTGKIVYWNFSASRMLGYPTNELMGKSVLEIIPPRYRDAHAAAFRRFVETGRGLIVGDTYEVHALTKDGAEIPIELSISGIQLKGKWHSAGIIRDISERKKLETQLMHSQKLEAIGQLAGGVAHDFNNILTAIIGYAHVLLMKMQESDPLRLNVSHMLEAADRAAQLTQSLLVFSRKQILNPHHFNLNELILRVETFLQRIIGEDVDLKSILHKDALTVNADPGQLEQVLMNLATNARDAMPQGGSFTIETNIIALDNSFVRAHGYGRKGLFALILVTDTGTGMSEEMSKKIFDPFFTTKDAGKGTGLGLSIAYGIVKQHHGYINVYSEPGMGTIFKIYLPLITTVEEPKPAATAFAEKELPRGTETVLVAEDDRALRHLARDVLEEVGYTVIEAENGDDAINKFMEQKDKIQIVVLDMIMPKKSGKEAFDAIRKVRPDIKAIFISGYTADRLHMENILGEGMELLLKPTSPKVLIKKVREILDR
jgi:PAS domain S-box-containing protein